uniref:G-protein coupled receptors family 1 profile domain-containing protein n=1 Tax=Mola mola TaxID=94237 RepID=A0A3Q3VZX6_MOLML
MSNTTLATAAGLAQLLCPLLQLRQNHSLNKDTKANLVVISIHGLFSCLGIFENALILWVVGFRLRRRTVASVWVLNLAMSDFLATLMLPFFTFYLKSSHSWELGTPLCKIQASIFFLNMFVSAFLLAAISLDRFFLVVKPVWSQNHRSVAGAWKVCMLGWLWAAINTLPYLLFRAVTEKNDSRKLCYHNFALLADVPLANKNEEPTTTCATPTTNKKTFLKPLNSPSSATFSPAMPNQPNHSQLSPGFTRMVTFVIAAFVLCWAPYHIFCMIEVSAQYWIQNLDLVEVGLPIATTFAFMNPVLNPILYAFSCPNFSVRIRQSLGAVFDGLVEEGLLMAPGKSFKAQTQRKVSQDLTVNMEGHLHIISWMLCVCVSPCVTMSDAIIHANASTEL